MTLGTDVYTTNQLYSSVEHPSSVTAVNLASVPKYNDNFCLNQLAFYQAAEYDTSVNPIEIWLGENYEHKLDYTFVGTWMETCEDFQHIWAD